MNKDICYGFILFFIIESILGIIEIGGYSITSYFLLNIYITPILLVLTTVILVILFLRLKIFPSIKLWIVFAIIFFYIGLGHLEYPELLVRNYPELERAMLFSFTKGIKHISLLIFVIIAYIRYYRFR